MLDILLITSVLLLLMTMVMLIFVLQNLGDRIEDTEEKLNYWRQKALDYNKDKRLYN